MRLQWTAGPASGQANAHGGTLAPLAVDFDVSLVAF